MHTVLPSEVDGLPAPVLVLLLFFGSHGNMLIRPEEEEEARRELMWRLPLSFGMTHA